MLQKFLRRYAELTGEVWSSFFSIFTPWHLVRLGLKGPAGGLILLHQFFETMDKQMAIASTLVAEILLESLEAIRKTRGTQQVMTFESALEMMFRVGAEQFVEAINANSPRVIGFGLKLRGLVSDSFQKKFLKLVGGNVAGIFLRSWTTTWFLLERATRLLGALFFLAYWAFTADFVINNLLRLRDLYALQQRTPRRNFKLVGGGKIRRRAPGGARP